MFGQCRSHLSSRIFVFDCKSNMQFNQVTYCGHAGAFTLSQFFQAVQAKRVHPITDCDSPDENPRTKIPAQILNGGCSIVCDSDSSSSDRKWTEVTLDDIRSAERPSILRVATRLRKQNRNIHKAKSKPLEDASNSSGSNESWDWISISLIQSA